MCVQNPFQGVPQTVTAAPQQNSTCLPKPSLLNRNVNLVGLQPLIRRGLISFKMASLMPFKIKQLLSTPAILGLSHQESIVPILSHLPSLPGLQSDCEEEIIMLMKEVDLEFQRQNSILLTELINARTLCKAQSSEIESLCRLLQSNNENSELKNENSSLQRRLQLIPDDNKVQLETLKRSLSVQPDENKSLRERLSKIDQQYQSLQNVYQNVISRLTAFSRNSENQNTNNIDVSSPSHSTQDIVVQITEKFVSEEAEYCSNFLSKINLEIDSLEKNLKKELS